MTAIPIDFEAASPVSKRQANRHAAIIKRVAVFQARNVLRSRWLAAYGVFFLLVTEGLLRFSGNEAGTILSLASIILYVVPLVTLVVGTVYLYNAREFIELLLAQPVKRGALFLGLYTGLAVPLVVSVVVGISVPFLLRGFSSATEGAMLATLIGTGIALTLSFVGIALGVALWCDDRLRGLSAAIGIWLLGAIVYDGLVLGLVAAFGDYALERPMLALTLANPIDLARVALLLQLDVSALMGYTGAVFQQFLGGAIGTLVAGASLALWVVVPVWLGLRSFIKKDF